MWKKTGVLGSGTRREVPGQAETAAPGHEVHP